MLPRYIKDTMIIKTGNPQLVSKIFELAIYDHHMESMIDIWYQISDDRQLGPWVLDEIQDYLLEADYNVWTC